MLLQSSTKNQESLSSLYEFVVHNNDDDHILLYILKIVDSIMALFRVDFSGRGELADRQQKLAQMLSRLQKISEGLVACVCITPCDKEILHTSP